MTGNEGRWTLRRIFRERDFLAALLGADAVAGWLSLGMILGWIDDGPTAVDRYATTTWSAARWVGPIVLAGALALAGIYHRASSSDLQWKLFHFRREERRAEQYLLVLWAPMAIGLGTAAVGWTSPIASGLASSFSLATLALLGILWSVASFGEALIQTYRLSLTTARTGSDKPEGP